MTASFVQPDRQTRSGPGTAAALIVGLIGTVVIFTLIMAGLTFVGLAIAFPIAGTVVAQYHVVVSPTDLAIAERFADVWWVFAGLAVASFAAAGLVVVKLIDFLSPAPRD